MNVLDIRLLVNTILGIAAAVGGDLNGDSRVDVLDLQVLVSVILGVGTCPNGAPARSSKIRMTAYATPESSTPSIRARTG